MQEWIYFFFCIANAHSCWVNGIMGLNAALNLTFGVFIRTGQTLNHNTAMLLKDINNASVYSEAG